MPRLTLLVVDHDPSLRAALRVTLGGAGYRVIEAEGVRTGIAAFEREGPDLVVLEYAMVDGTVFDLLDALVRLDARVPVIVVSGCGSIENAVHAMKRGVRDFLAKPVRPAALLSAVERALAVPTSTADRDRPADPFVGTSAAIRALASEAGRAAASSGPVLILGEAGVGKGVLARWLHDHGQRRDGPFAVVSCAGMPAELLEAELFGQVTGGLPRARAPRAGLLETAQGGTLFLDDLGEVELSLQGRLLALVEGQRFRPVGAIEDRRADVRVITATHRHLPERVQANAFRADLLSTLGALSLTIRPLRERPEDIPPLVSRLLARLPARSRRVTLSPAAVAALQAHGWPGNVRELRNTLERAVLRNEDRELAPEDLGLEPPAEAPARSARPARDRAAPSFAASRMDTLRDLERALILEILEQEHYRVLRASVRLGIPRSTLYQKLRTLGLQLPAGRRRG